MKNHENKIKIGIVDDDRLFVQLLESFLQSTNEIEVQQTALSGDDFFESKDPELDILLLDLRMHNGSGLGVLHELLKQSTQLKIIVLSTFYRSSFMGQMFKLGVHAFLPKEIDGEELLTVIKEVYRKGYYFSEEQLTIMRSQIAKKTPEYHTPQKDGLTAREKEVLEAICQQLTTREIGDRLFISPKTVEAHKTSLLLKTGARNSAGLIIYAIQNKLVDPAELLFFES